MSRRVALAVVVVGLLAACGGGDDGAASVTTAATTATTAVRFTVDGSFAAALPAEPVERTDDVATPFGSIAFERYAVEDGDLDVVVSTATLPSAPPDPQQALGALFRQVLESVGGEIVTEVEPVGQVSPTRDGELSATVDGRAVVVVLRIVLDGTRVFELQVTGPADDDGVKAAFEQLVAGFEPLEPG